MWYYTPLPVVEFLSDFATTWKTRNILEPSCGDGRFFEALSKAISRNGSKKVNKETVYKVLQIALAVLILGLSSGCHNTLTQEERAGINYVSINPEVSMPRSMYFGTRGGHIYLDLLALDVVSGAMARRLTRGRYIEAMMREHDICPDKMIVNQFREQLEAKQIFPLIVEAGGDATFTFKISSFGLDWYSSETPWPPYPFKPVLHTYVYLRKADGTLVWEDYVFTNDYTEGVDPHMYEEYVEDPNVLRKNFEQVTSKVVESFFENIEAN